MYKQIVIGLIFVLMGKGLLLAGFVNIKDKYEIDMNGFDYYAHSGGTNIVLSENAKWALLNSQTNANKYLVFKLNLETGEKTVIPEEYQTSVSSSLVGISNDGDKIVYKKALGSGYGNFYLYTFSNNQETNLLLGPNENSPDRQSYSGSINKQFDKFTVMSYAHNWGGGTR